MWHHHCVSCFSHVATDLKHVVSWSAGLTLVGDTGSCKRRVVLGSTTSVPVLRFWPAAVVPSAKSSAGSGSHPRTRLSAAKPISLRPPAALVLCTRLVVVFHTIWAKIFLFRGWVPNSPGLLGLTSSLFKKNFVAELTTDMTPCSGGFHNSSLE